MATTTTAATWSRTPAGGSCTAKTRRASGMASSGTTQAAIAAAKAMRHAARPATMTRTHKPTASRASIAAVRAPCAVVPSATRASA